MQLCLKTQKKKKKDSSVVIFKKKKNYFVGGEEKEYGFRASEALRHFRAIDGK